MFLLSKIIFPFDFSIPSEHSINLRTGWNLIGYWRHNSITPDLAFSDLIENNLLLYATSFNSNGAVYYEPGGIFNTLNILENGFGYWIKLNSDYQNFEYPQDSYINKINTNINTSINPDIIKTNNFMFINGTVSLKVIEPKSKNHVYTDTDILVGEILILDNKYLQTSAIYGDDKTTTIIDGALPNQKLKLL